MDDLAKTLLLYVAVMNVIAFLLMAKDKRNAKSKQRRVRERTLLIVAALGGSLGAVSAMRLYRHKTKHAVFMYGLPLFVIAHVLLLAYAAMARYF